MQLKIHPAIRAVIAFAMFALFILAMVQWEWLTPIITISKFLTYIIVAVWGVLTGAVCYALLPTKKVVENSFSNIKDREGKSLPLGYWLWLALFVVVYCGALALYINDL